MEITYESIRPYLLEESIDGSRITCKFKVEDQEFESFANIKTNMKDGTARVTKMVKNTALGRLRSTVLRVLRRAVGGGFAGTAVSMAGNEAMRQGTDSIKHSQKDKEEAIIRAFEKITAELAFEGGKWRLAKEFAEFEKRLKKNPITKAYDKKILARMLVEIARADGAIEKEEKEFFEDFLNEETGTLGELMRAPAVSVVECEEITKEGKENVFMIVAAVAISDHEYEDEERFRLEEYATMMGFSDDTRDELIRYAQDYTIEMYIRSNDVMTRDEVYAFADKIGMDRGEAERTQIRLDKRLN